MRITKPFYLGVYEVTVGQFGKFVSDTGYKTDAERNKDFEGAWGFNAATGEFEQSKGYSWRQVGFPQGDDHPVVNVSHNDAVAFCAWLSRKEGQPYRLPTEAEWEYACRAGTTTRYYHGDDPEGLSEVGNVADGTAKSKFSDWDWTIAGRDGYVFTAPVGKYKANGFGLYDMHGNVWEWCADWYEAEVLRGLAGGRSNGAYGRLDPGAPGRQLGRRRRELPGGLPRRVRAVGPEQQPGLPPREDSFLPTSCSVERVRSRGSGAWSVGRGGAGGSPAAACRSGRRSGWLAGYSPTGAVGCFRLPESNSWKGGT